MTEEEFRKKWRGVWMQLGMDTLAAIQGRQKLADGPSAGDALLDLGGKVDGLILRMYRELKPEEVNGKVAAKK